MDKSLLIRFSIPAVLAIVAAVFQSLAIREMVETDTYIVLKKEFQPGDIIQADDIEAVEISKRYAARGSIEINDSAIAIGTSVKRQVNAGEPLLRSDLLIDRKYLDIIPNEIPVNFQIENDIVRSNGFYVGQEVYLLFYNEGPTTKIEEFTYPASTEIEVGPLRIVSIGEAIAPYSEPSELVRSLAVAVPHKNQHKAMLFKAQGHQTDFTLRGIYSRPTKN